MTPNNYPERYGGSGLQRWSRSMLEQNQQELLRHHRRRVSERDSADPLVALAVGAAAIFLGPAVGMPMLVAFGRAAAVGGLLDLAGQLAADGHPEVLEPDRWSPRVEEWGFRVSREHAMKRYGIQLDRRSTPLIDGRLSSWVEVAVLIQSGDLIGFEE